MSDWLRECAMERLKEYMDGEKNGETNESEDVNTQCVKPCPFCMKALKEEYDNAHRKRYVHPNNECILNCFMFADNEANVERWNRRGM